MSGSVPNNYAIRDISFRKTLSKLYFNKLNKMASRWCALFWVTRYANGRTLKYELELVFLFHKDRAILIGHRKIQIIDYEAQIE